MRTLVLADNQDITRYGIKLLCSACSGIGNVVEVTCKEELVQGLLHNPCALVVLDLSLIHISEPTRP